MPVRLLLVDDHELIRAGLRLRLQREAHLTVVADASDAPTALAATAAHAPDVVVMDLELPGEDGLTVTRTLKARWPAIRVLALTGSRPASIAQEALLAGVDGLVFKGEGSDDLPRAISVVAAGKIYLSPDAATGLVQQLRQPASAPTPPAGPTLSAREETVLKGLANGLSYKELAAEMGVSVKSVDTYRARLTKKLGCSTRADLVRTALRLGLVQP